MATKIRTDIKDGAPETLTKQAEELPNYFIDNSGLYNTYLPEANPNYNKTNAEKIIKGGNNQFIIIGRDRPRGTDSGYGGLGNSHAACIDIIAGMSGMMAREVDSQGEEIYTDKSPELDAARIYISQRTDIDENFNLVHGKVGSPRTRSGIAIKADGVRLIARDGIKLVTGTDTYNSQGVKVNIRSGIDLIAGNEESGLEHLVKGEKLIAALDDIINYITQLTGIVINVQHNYAQLLASLAVHVHVSTAPGTPVSPSPDLAAAVAVQYGNLTSLMLDMTTHEKNAVMLKGQYLFPPGEGYINSKYNTTN
jgi:hypothetical protein